MDERERRAAIHEVREFLHKNEIDLDDLIAYGGEDLNNLPGSRARETAKVVERAWSMMARLGLDISDLEENEDDQS